MSATYQKGIELLQAGKYEAALETFNKGLAQQPNDPYLISERGVCYFHLGKLKEALEEMNKALQLEPQNPYRYSSRAYIKGQKGDIEGAIADYEQAIALDPEDAVAHNNLGLLEEKLGYQQKAQKHFKKADFLTKDDNIDGRSDQGIQGEPIKARNIQKEIEEERSQQSLGKTMASVFSKEGLSSFGRFIKSGFKNI